MCVYVCVCACVKYNLVHASVFFETKNLWQTTVLSQTQAVQCTLLNYLKHRPLHRISYSYCSHQWYSVSYSYMTVVLYWVLLKTGLESTADVLCFPVDKVGSVYTSMFDALQFWYLDRLYYRLHTVLYNIMLCVYSTVVNDFVFRESGNSSLKLSDVHLY